MVPSYRAVRNGDLDMTVTVTSEDPSADGYNICWGYAPDKLYHSALVFEKETGIGALTRGQDVYVRVDAFGRTGITHGTELLRL